MVNDTFWSECSFYALKCILDHTRLTKKIALWDKSICVKNWSSDMISFLLSINKLNEFETFEALNINVARNLMTQKMNEKWRTDILSKPKLRTYVTFKSVLQTEEYLRNNMSRHKRSLLVQLRLGILPLEIELKDLEIYPLKIDCVNVAIIML